VPKSRILFGTMLIHVVTLVYWRHISNYSSDVLAPVVCCRPGQLSGPLIFRRKSYLQFVLSFFFFFLSLSVSISISISSRRVVSPRSSPYRSTVCRTTLPGSCRPSDDEVRSFCDVEENPSSCAPFEFSPSLSSEAGRRVVIRGEGRRLGANGGTHCRLFS
jgi:hypothetical protein